MPTAAHASLLTTLACLLACAQDPSPNARIAAAAREFLASLDEKQRGSAVIAFTDSRRTAWNYVPGEYPGVLLRDLTPAQKGRVHDLLRSALSAAGYLKTTSIIRLEEVLRAIAESAGRQAPMRDPLRYSIAVFGTPATETPWGWRLQGHHVSLQLTLAGDKLSATTPAFLGANPAEVRTGPHAGLRVLATEEDLGFELLASCDAEQRKAATLAAEAPADIVLSPGHKADLLGGRKGLAAGRMSADQRALLWTLIEAYASNLRPDLAEPQLARIRTAGIDSITFAWAGGDRLGQPHYYRIHGPTFVIELDNTQDQANHVHTVWHDLENDFGEDLLRKHYAEQHGK